MSLNSRTARRSCGVRHQLAQRERTTGTRARARHGTSAKRARARSPAGAARHARIGLMRAEAHSSQTGVTSSAGKHSRRPRAHRIRAVLCAGTMRLRRNRAGSSRRAGGRNLMPSERLHSEAQPCRSGHWLAQREHDLDTSATQTRARRRHRHQLAQRDATECTVERPRV